MKQLKLENTQTVKMLDNENIEGIFEGILENVPVALLVADRASRTIVLSNKALSSLISVSSDEIIGRVIDDALPQVWREYENNFFGMKCIGKNSKAICIPFIFGDNSSIYLNIMPINFSIHNRDFIIFTFSAIKSVLDRPDVAEKISSHNKSGILITNGEGNIVWANEAWCHITGYDLEEVMDENPRFLKSDIQDKKFYQKMWRTLLIEGEWTGEIWNRRRDGSLMCELLTVYRVGNQESDNVIHIGILSDISELRILQRKLSRSELFDALTGLPTRRNIMTKIRDDVKRKCPNKADFALIWVNILGFRRINQSFGLSVGDEVLAQLAHQITETVGPDGTVARAAGDEFVVYLPGMSADEAIEVATAIQTYASAVEFKALGKQALKLAIGISEARGTCIEVEELFSEAAAAAEANASSSSPVSLYNPSLLNKVRSHLETSNSIKTAIDKDELHLVYQPKISLKTKRAIGAEVLVRWRGPDGMLVPPGQWLPAIQGTPLMESLDEWVLRRAMRDLAEMRKVGVKERISINITPRTLSKPNFAILVKSGLLEAGVKPTDVLFEVTETELMQERGKAISRMRELSALGIRFALDDFGTGYSSLAYLRDLPVHEIKLDRSLVNGVHADPRAASVIKAAFAVATSFNLDTVCEGIENREDIECIASFGCDLVQGFYFSKPLEKNEYIEYYQKSWNL